jgi:pyruvate dehydrogenase E1 component alpha subunit
VFNPSSANRYLDNKYGMGTSAERASAMTDYYKRGLYIPGLRVNGMDVLAVMAAVKHGREFIRAGNGPLVYEYVTYRYAGHSMSDPGIAYRTREELKAERANDPVSNFRGKLIDWGVITEDEAKTIDKNVREKVNKEAAEAEKMPEPEPRLDVLFQDVYIRGSEPDQYRGRTVDETQY